MDDPLILHVRTSVLEVAYEAHGPAAGTAVVLLHGFPYDPRCYDPMVAPLAARGYRVLVPYLRGYGETRFLAPETPRSGQQGALGRDLVEFLDALAIPRAALVGYDWGGRAACIVAALWPERVLGLVTGGGYNIQDIAAAARPLVPEVEHTLWYQYYFHSPRGREGLAAHRYDLGRLLWRLWSPTWAFDQDDYARTAQSFETEDFVDVVVHSYRHRFGYAAGDPAYDDIEAALARQPVIAVPTISLCGQDSGFGPPDARDGDAPQFAGRYERWVLAGVGHNIPQEAPEATLRAVVELLEG
jgi:pimeloyl-ACP methyl ester carboxylesterase